MPGVADRPPSALVVGARGLGRATGRVLRETGWRVAGGARSEATLAGVEADGGLPVELDVVDAASVEAAIARVAEAHGGIDLLVDGSIAPIDAADAARAGSGDPLDPAQVDPYEAGAAVLALARQGRRAASHELVVTPLAEPFTP